MPLDETVATGEVGHLGAHSALHRFFNLFEGKTPGAADGIATLDSTGKVPASQIATSGGPFDRHKSGLYDISAGAAQSTSIGLSDGAAHAIPFLVGRDLTIDRIGIELATAGVAGSLLRLGIYADAETTGPSTLVLDAGTVAGDAAAPAFLEIIINQALTKGMWWLVCARQGTAGANPDVRAVTGNLIGIGGNSSGMNAARNNLTGYTATISGALPSPFPAITGTTGFAAAVTVRYV